MSKVVFNKQLSKDFFLLKASDAGAPTMGQFYMLRAWENYPLLSRPISVYDADSLGVTFLYKVVGEGTELLSKLREGDDITCAGPYGNGYPLKSGKIALVGGGVGIAPLYLVAKKLAENPGANVDIYLGFSDEKLLCDEFGALCDSLFVNVGGYVTDDIDPARYDAIYTCGPEIMMKTLYNKAKNCAAELFVSMENRMGCGIGACLVCTCKTSHGNKKACKDGPVFLGKEVYSI